MRKERIKIPQFTATDIKYLCDMTCCICEEKGKAIQIHHIDENPSNNDISNLAVLCLECHNNTMISGGFGRKLDKHQVSKYREEWIERVKTRRKKADEIASLPKAISKDFETNRKILEFYLDHINSTYVRLNNALQEKLKSGISSEMGEASYEIIDFYKEILINLSKFYSENNINNMAPADYFSDIITIKFYWHYFLNSYEEGSIIFHIVSGGVMKDIKSMISEMVSALVFSYDLEICLENYTLFNP